MARKGVKMGLGDFLGDSAAAYIPEAALPTGPRARDPDDDGRGGRFGDRRGGDRGDRGYDREPTRSDQSDQWRGDRSAGGDRGGGDRFGGGDRGGDRFGDRGGGDRFGGDRGGPSRYDRPSRDNVQEERPAHMRLNLARRGDGNDARGPSSSGGASDDKFAGAFARRFGGGDAPPSSGGGDRFGNRDRFEERRGGGGYDDRRGGGGGYDDRRGGGGGYDDRRGGGGYDDRRGGGGGYDDRRGGGGYDDRRGGDSLSSGFNSMRVNDNAPAAPVVNEETDKKAKAQKMREERKKKAEEERLALEEAKRKAAEEKKAKEEAFLKRTEGDRAIMQEVLASGKLGDELTKVAKEVFAKSGTPNGAAVIETVTKKVEAVAKASANWIAPKEYGGLLKLALATAEVADQVKALYALQMFLNAHDFPKGVMEKCFMALYTLDILDEKAFLDYKYDVDSDAPGRMKAIVQTSNWLTWLETPEEESEEEDE